MLHRREEYIQQIQKTILFWEDYHERHRVRKRDLEQNDREVKRLKQIAIVENQLKNQTVQKHRILGSNQIIRFFENKMFLHHHHKDYVR